jgi:hypothetical protein
LLFNFALECAIKSDQVNQDGLKFSCAPQLPVYADIVNIFGRSLHTMKSTEVFVAASKETGLEVNADKTKYMVMYRDQNARRSQNIKPDNETFEIVEQFKYLRKPLTNQKSIQEEIKSRLKSGNACCHSVQNLLPSILLSKNVKLRYTDL